MYVSVLLPSLANQFLVIFYFKDGSYHFPTNLKLTYYNIINKTVTGTLTCG